jgi:hypothetical protein
VIVDHEWREGDSGHVEVEFVDVGGTMMEPEDYFNLRFSGSSEMQGFARACAFIAKTLLPDEFGDIETYYEAPPLLPDAA